MGGERGEPKGGLGMRDSPVLERCGSVSAMHIEHIQKVGGPYTKRKMGS